MKRFKGSEATAEAFQDLQISWISKLTKLKSRQKKSREIFELKNKKGMTSMKISMTKFACWQLTMT